MEIKRRPVDLHPKRYIFAQIFLIVFGTGILYRGLSLIGGCWMSRETYNLPLGVAYVAIGVAIVLSRLIVVNDALSRVESKITTGSDTKQSEHSSLSQPNPL
jgi:hypothetical protein